MSERKVRVSQQPRSHKETKPATRPDQQVSGDECQATGTTAPPGDEPRALPKGDSAKHSKRRKRDSQDNSQEMSDRPAERAFFEAGAAAQFAFAFSGAIIPDGDSWRPCPEVLTESEAVRYLRLDLIDVKDRSAALSHYRKKGLLRATQIGKSVRYLRIELNQLLKKLTDENSR